MDKKLMQEEKDLRKSEGLDELDLEYYTFQEKLKDLTASVEVSEQLDQAILAVAKGHVRKKKSVLAFVWPCLAIAAALLLAVNVSWNENSELADPTKPILTELSQNKASDSLDLTLEIYQMATTDSAVSEDLIAFEDGFDGLDDILTVYGF